MFILSSQDASTGYGPVSMIEAKSKKFKIRNTTDHAAILAFPSGFLINNQDFVFVAAKSHLQARLVDGLDGHFSLRRRDQQERHPGAGARRIRSIRDRGSIGFDVGAETAGEITASMAAEWIAATSNFVIRVKRRIAACIPCL